MFKELSLKYFRQHADLTVNFDNGVVALRGANEAGKTTLLEAVAYAMGGALMLREALSDVVTWGQKETALKVRLTFAINDVEYIVTRSKSGAEIKSGPEIKAVGQTEVTRYIEALIGCSIKTATQLMLANQAKLRGTLEEDGAAVKLIEQLADFALIDKIIGLVQTKLPSGATTAVESRVKTLEDQLAVPLVDETGPFVEAVAAAEHVLATRAGVYSTAKATYDDVQEPARQAQQRIDAAAVARQGVQTASTRLEQAKVTLAGIVIEDPPPDQEVANLRQQVQDVTRYDRAMAAHRALVALPQPDNEWEGNMESLTTEMQQTDAALRQYQIQMSETDSKIARLSGQRITQTACGLCGKDLSNVPEVVKKNAELNTQITALQAVQVVASTAHNEALELRKAYQAIGTASATASRVYQQHAEFIELDHGYVPARWVWKGPDQSLPRPADPGRQLQDAEFKVARVQQARGRKLQQESVVQQLQSALAVSTAQQEAAISAVGDAQAALDVAAAATVILCDAEREFREADLAVKQAANELTSAKALHAERMRARAAVEAQLVSAKKDLDEMRFNNALIDALRKARPSIVEELWNMVAATVSQYFSDIRGVVSIFERDDSSFKVDGKGIKGLSGSTLDALGLAIRMALTRMFLPNTRFMVLDEPAAAADSDRETNMLGVIASSQFDQVILVTHSDLCDSFASQLIQL